MSNLVDIVIGAHDDTGPAIGTALNAFKGLASGAALGFAAITAAGVGLVGATIAIGSSFDDAFDKIRVATGKTGNDLGGLEEDFKSVVQEVPTDFGKAADAISLVNQRLGLTGEPLVVLTDQFLELSRITKTDVSENVGLMTRLFGDWSVSTERQSGVMDELFRASQATGTSVNDLATTVVQFGAPLRGLGFTMEDSVAMLGKWQKEGVNVGNVMGAMKKAFGEFSKEFGDKAPEEFRKFMDQIARAPSLGAAASIAIEKLGVRNGPDFAAAVKEGRFAYGDLVSQIENGSDTILNAGTATQHFGEKWTLFANQLKVAVEPVATQVVKALGDAMDQLVPHINDVGAWLGQNLPKAIDTVKAKWEEWGPTVTAAVVTVAEKVADLKDQFTEWAASIAANQGALIGLGIVLGVIAVAMLAIESPIVLIVAGFALLAAGLSWVWNNFQIFHTAVDQVREGFTQFVSVIQPLVSFITDNAEAFENLGKVLLVVAAIIIGVVVAAIVAVVAVIAVAVVAIAAGIAAMYKVGQVLWDVFQNAKDGVATAGGAIVSFFANIGSALATAWSAVSDFFTNLGSNIAGWVSTAVSAVSDFIGRVVSFFEGLPEKIGGALEALPGLIMGFLGRAFDNATFYLGYAIGLIVKLVVGLVVGIVNEITALPGQIAAVFQAAWNLATNLASMIVWSVIGFFQQLPGRAMDALSALWGVITSVFNTARDFAVSTVQALVAAVIDFFQQLPGRAAGALAALWGAIQGAFFSAKDGATNTANSLVSTVTDFLGSLPGRAGAALSGFAGAVGNALSSVIGAARDIGGNIIRAVADGITGGIGWVVDGAKRAAGNIISGFKSALGISSPSKPMLELGDVLMQSIGIGATGGVHQLHSVLDTAVKGALPGPATIGQNPLQPGTATGASGGLSGGGVTHHWHIQGSIRSDRDLVRLVRDELTNLGFGLS